MEQIQKIFNKYRSIKYDLTTASYASARLETLNKVKNVLFLYGLSKCIRGSWKHGDFHLNSQGLSSYSDIDLMVPDMSGHKRRELSSQLSSRIKREVGMKVPVSIHFDSSLTNISLHDAKLLCFPEYLYQLFKIKRLKTGQTDYINAKFSLLLLRKSTSERYYDTCSRINTDLSTKAYQVKIGCSNIFTNKNMLSLLESNNDEIVNHFINSCIISKPSIDTIKKTFDYIENNGNINFLLLQNITNKLLSIGIRLH